MLLNILIWMEDGLMVSEISDMLKIARPTVTQLVNSLQKKGFLEKYKDENDKRVVRINLSEKGKSLAKQGADEFYKRFEGLAEILETKKVMNWQIFFRKYLSILKKPNQRKDKQWLNY